MSEKVEKERIGRLIVDTPIDRRYIDSVVEAIDDTGGLQANRSTLMRIDVFKEANHDG